MDRRYFIYGASTLLALGVFATTSAKADDDDKNKKDDNKDSGGDHSDSGEDGEDNGGDGGDGSGGEGSGGEDSGGGDGETDDKGGKGDSGARDSERAKQRVDARDALPLDIVMQTFREMGDFMLIDVRLQRSNKTLLYVFKYVDGSGKVKKCYFDARTGLPIE